MESNLSFYKRFIPLIIIAELIIFLFAYLVSRNNLSLDNFSGKLFLIGLISLILTGSTPGNTQRHKTLGYNFTPVTLEGSQEIPVAFSIASKIAIVLSVAIPVIAWFLEKPS